MVSGAQKRKNKANAKDNATANAQDGCVDTGRPDGNGGLKPPRSHETDLEPLQSQDRHEPTASVTDADISSDENVERNVVPWAEARLLIHGLLQRRRVRLQAMLGGASYVPWCDLEASVENLNQRIEEVVTKRRLLNESEGGRIAPAVGRRLQHLFADVGGFPLSARNLNSHADSPEEYLTELFAMTVEELEQRSDFRRTSDVGCDVLAGHLQHFQQFRAIESEGSEARPSKKQKAIGFHWVLYRPPGGRNLRGMKHFVYYQKDIIQSRDDAKVAVQFTLKPQLPDKPTSIDQLWRQVDCSKA